MKRLLVVFALLFAANQAVFETAHADLTSRDARQLRLAARKRTPAVKQVDLSVTCADTEVLAGNQLHKSEGSGHLAKDPRGKSCAWIVGSGSYNLIPKKATKWDMYDSEGTKLTYFRLYERGGCPFPFRAYTNWVGPTCKQLAATAVRNTGNRQVYINVGNGKCLKINSILGRQGGNGSTVITSNKAHCRKR